jgi:hypothetical protein
METVFEVYDSDGEPILSFESKGFTPAIGTQVDFYDEINGNWVEVSAIVDKYIYNWDENKMTINCTVFYDMTKYDYSKVQKYNEAKYK